MTTNQNPSVFQSERNKSKINPDELSLTVFGDAKLLQSYKDFQAKLEKRINPNPVFLELSREHMMAYKIKETTKIKEMFTQNIVDNKYHTHESVNNFYIHEMGFVGRLMCSPLVNLLGTDAQKKAWLPSIDKGVWNTCYAQTELAHGSDFNNIKTIATFDPATQEFVVHTPDIEAIKWWPGDLGVFSTHCLLMAQLYTKGKNHGVQPFFIQIRDTETFEVLPGLEIGDIGPKFGYLDKDNGFMRFNRFRIPKTALLGKYIGVEEDGTLWKKNASKITYSGMMITRFSLVAGGYSTMFKCVMIAMRYSLLRKQFKDSQGKEIRIYDYQLQKEKLFSELVKAYAMASTVYFVRRLVSENFDRSAKNDFSLLQPTHILLCASKALFTWWASKGCMKLIQACGGHGYHMYSYLPYVLRDNFADTILEGENSVLMLQVSRNLLKAAQNAQAGNPKGVSAHEAYFLQAKEIQGFTFEATKKALANPENLIKAFQKTVIHQTQLGAIEISQKIAEGMDPKAVWDYTAGSRLLKMGLAQANYMMVNNFDKRAKQITEPHIREAYEKMFQLFTIQRIEELCGEFMSAKAITPDHVALFHEIKVEIFDYLTPHGLVLSEAVPFSDGTLFSQIALSNETPYENLYNTAKKGAINRIGGPHPAMLDLWLPFSKKLYNEALTDEERKYQDKL